MSLLILELQYALSQQVYFYCWELYTNHASLDGCVMQDTPSRIIILSSVAHQWVNCSTSMDKPEMKAHIKFSPWANLYPKSIAVDPLIAYQALSCSLLNHVIKTALYRFGWVDLKDLHYRHGRTYWAWPAYGQSKMSDLLWAKELSRK